MTAAMLVLEPIFEADLPLEIYAYRAGRNAQQAAVEVEELLFRRYPEVVDDDLADYFGSIPHADLLKSVAPRIVDRRVLHLIKMWLDCPVEETDERGRKTRTTEARDKRRAILGKLKLTANEEKTRICKVPEGEFDFLGFTFGQMFSRTTGQARLALRPSKKSIKRMVDKVHVLTVRSRTWQDHNAGRRTESCVSRVGQLLQCRLFSPSLSRAR